MSNTETKYIIGKFDKVSFEDYKKSMCKYFPTYEWQPNELEVLYEQVKLPERSSKNVSGYDFFAPFGFNLRPGNRIYVPTGIYVKMDNPWMLISSPNINQYNLSISLFIDKVSKSNEEETTEEIPLTDNEGHVILVFSIPIMQYPNFHGAISKFGRDLRMKSEDIKFKVGDKFARATFLPYGITINDEKDEDNERVDETRIIENFVWSEELYPGSTNPELDGMKVVVLIINDGTNTSYTFASIKDVNINDETPPSTETNPDENESESGGGDNTETGEDEIDTTEPEITDPSTGNGTGSGDSNEGEDTDNTPSENPDNTTGEDPEIPEGGDDVTNPEDETGDDSESGDETTTTDPDEESGNNTEIPDTEEGNGLPEDPKENENDNPEDDGKEPENQPTDNPEQPEEGTDETGTVNPDDETTEDPIIPPDGEEDESGTESSNDNPESGESTETTEPLPEEEESSPEHESEEPTTGEENNEEQEPTENIETPVEDNGSEPEQEGE